MKEIKGNIWDFYDKGGRVVITTNGTIKINGEAVMGRGVALEAKLRFPQLPQVLGGLIKDWGNRVHRLDQYRLISFPVKHNYWETASMELIKKSTEQLKIATGFASGLQAELIYLVRPGCGNGRLDWKDVKLILERYLDGRFIVFQN